MTQHLQHREDALLEHQRNSEFFDYANQAAITFSSAVIRSLLLLNGGAAVAMLSFVAALAIKESALVLNMSVAISALIYFAWGAWCAVLTTAFAYGVMYFQAAESASRTLTWEHPYLIDGKKTKWLGACHVVLHVSAVVLILISLTMFLMGVFSTAEIVEVQPSGIEGLGWLSQLITQILDKPRPL